MIAAFGEAIKPRWRRRFAHRFEEVLEAGVRVKAGYQGSDGLPLAEAVITKADCSASG